MGIKFSNNAYGTLNASISTSDTSLTLSSGQGARFPTLTTGDYFYATLIDTSNNLEVVKCTARSSDVLTITRAQESTTARAFAIGDRLELRVTAAALEDSSNPYDKDTSSTGSFALPVGTTAQQPAAADTEGHIRYDSDDSIIYYSNGTSWLKISATVAQLSSVSGNIFAGAASTLTLTGSGFLTANLVVNFTQASDSINENITVTPTSDTSATVTTTSAIYSNVTSGNAVTIQVTNSDGVASGAQSVTAAALPSGGTVTTSGGYRIHRFTSSGSFTVATGVTLSCECLIVAGGGSGGSHSGGGGGAGGLLYYGAETPKTPNGAAISVSGGTHTVTVGGGAASAHVGAYPNPNGNDGNKGTNSSIAFSSTYTAIGGGGGLSINNVTANRDGGSGGGGIRSQDGYSVSYLGGSGTTGQGNNGGGGLTTGGMAPNYPGHGGGGAGAVGGTGSQSGGGHGGNGLSYSITGSSVVYAGGGGGNIQYDTSLSGGSGGSGGGGAGGGPFSGASGQGGAGAANTGGGGGGSRYDATVGGGAGGSGVVIIRYQL